MDTDGTPVQGAARVNENTYKLMPGHEYDKDPTVHVDADSEDSYIFVKVENEITDIEADTKIAAQITTTNGWTALDGVANVYYKEYDGTVKDFVVFENFKIADTVDAKALESYAGKTIKITAYAVQMDGFTGAADAWGKTFGK